MHATKKPPEPVHVPGTMRGEEVSIKRGKEPGRLAGRKNYRTMRDATGINADDREPIHPAMPHIPPQ
jgi:hypothetical protein